MGKDSGATVHLLKQRFEEKQGMYLDSRLVSCYHMERTNHRVELCALSAA